MNMLSPEEHRAMVVKIYKLKQRFKSKKDLYTYLETHRKYFLLGLATTFMKYLTITCI